MLHWKTNKQTNQQAGLSIQSAHFSSRTEVQFSAPICGTSQPPVSMLSLAPMASPNRHGQHVYVAHRHTLRHTHTHTKYIFFFFLKERKDEFQDKSKIVLKFLLKKKRSNLEDRNYSKLFIIMWMNVPCRKFEKGLWVILS